MLFRAVRRTKAAMRTRLAPLLIGLMTSVSVFGTATAEAGPDDTVVVKVGTETVTKGELERRLSKIPGLQLGMMGSTPEAARRAYVEKVIVPELLLSQGARAKKLDANDEVRLKLQDAYRQAVLTQNRKQFGDPSLITNDEIVRYYEDNRDKFQTPERVQIWRIQLATKQEAQQVLDEVRKPDGEKRWKDIAREKSTDKATSERGGDLGLVGPDGQTAVPTVRVEASLFEGAKKVSNGEIVPEVIAEGKRWAVVWRRGATPAVNRPIELEAGQIRQLLARQKLEGSTKETLTKLRTELVSDVTYDLLSLVEIGSHGEITPRQKPGVTKVKATGKPQPSAGSDGLR